MVVQVNEDAVGQAAFLDRARVDAERLGAGPREAGSEAEPDIFLSNFPFPACKIAKPCYIKTFEKFKTHPKLFNHILKE